MINSSSTSQRSFNIDIIWGIDMQQVYSITNPISHDSINKDTHTHTHTHIYTHIHTHTHGWLADINRGTK